MSIVKLQPIWRSYDGIHKFGYNADVDANAPATVDIIRVDGTQTWLTAAAAAADIDIASSSIEDDPSKPPAGTGMHSITIEGLDGSGNLQSETIAMNGQADVHPVNDYWRIHRAYGATFGTGETNAGNITIDVGDTDTLAYIAASEGQTQQAAYTIPNDYREGRLLSATWSLEGNTSATMDFVIRTRENTAVGTTTGWRWLSNISIANGVTHTQDYKYPIRLAPLTDIVASAVNASAANLKASAEFTILLIP